MGPTASGSVSASVVSHLTAASTVRAAGPAPRTVSGVCETCDNDGQVHEGPVVQRRGLYEVREIAEALVPVANGVTYTKAARRVRGRYWGAGGKGTRRPSTVEGGQTVAEWLQQFGPWSPNRGPRRHGRTVSASTAPSSSTSTPGRRPPDSCSWSWRPGDTRLATPRAAVATRSTPDRPQHRLA